MRSSITLLMLLIISSVSVRAQGEKEHLEAKSIDMGICVSNKRLFPSGIVRTSQEYKSLKNSIKKNISKECEDFSLPKLDLDKYDLIFNYIKSGGCSQPELFPELYYDSDRNLIHHLKIKEDSGCRMTVHVYSWTLTPNLPVDQTIIYEHEFVANN